MQFSGEREKWEDTKKLYSNNCDAQNFIPVVICLLSLSAKYKVIKFF